MVLFVDNFITEALAFVLSLFAFRVFSFTTVQQLKWINVCLSLFYWHLKEFGNYGMLFVAHIHIFSLKKIFVLPHLFYFYTFYSFNFFLSLMTLFCYYFRVESRKKSITHTYVYAGCVWGQKKKGKSIFPIKLCVCVTGQCFLM